jgi:hypothetical protein
MWREIMQDLMLDDVRQDPVALASMPVMDIEMAVRRREQLVEFVRRILRADTDYGKIPGTEKNTLLKPGAEKLTTFFGLTKRYRLITKVEDWDGARHGGEPFFYYLYRCQLWRGDFFVAESDGSCNSWERKYRFRRSDRVCPECSATAIKKGKPEYGGGWVCYRGKGGCGARWADGDATIEQQTVESKNDNPADLVNTIQKMAQKRALIAATLLAVNASEFFTQDMEDLDGHFRDAVPGKGNMSVSVARPAPAATVPTGNGHLLNDHRYRKYSAMFRAARTPEKLHEFWTKLERDNVSLAVRDRLLRERDDAARRILAGTARDGCEQQQPAGHVRPLAT